MSSERARAAPGRPHYRRQGSWRESSPSAAKGIFRRTPGSELVCAPGSTTVLNARRRDPVAGLRVGGADVAQLVEHHLAKVRVAGSNPVVRSEARLCGKLAAGEARSYGGVAEWLRQGPAKPCTRVRFPSPPLSVLLTREREDVLMRPWSRG